MSFAQNLRILSEKACSPLRALLSDAHLRAERYFSPRTRRGEK